VLIESLDRHLVPRVSVARAARYLGRSPRWVQQAIAAGRIPAIDTSSPGSRRPTWSIAVRDLRAFIVRAELAAERRREEAQRAKEANESAGASSGAADSCHGALEE
jgi:hypothetical protein